MAQTPSPGPRSHPAPRGKRSRGKRGRARTRRKSEMRRVFHAAARKAAGGGKGKRGRRRGYDPRRGTVDGKYFASVLQWWLETEEGAAKRNPPHAPPIPMLREKWGPSKWKIFRTSAAPSFEKVKFRFHILHYVSGNHPEKSRSKNHVPS